MLVKVTCVICRWKRRCWRVPRPLTLRWTIRHPDSRMSTTSAPIAQRRLDTKPCDLQPARFQGCLRWQAGRPCVTHGPCCIPSYGPTCTGAAADRPIKGTWEPGWCTERTRNGPLHVPETHCHGQLGVLTPPTESPACKCLEGNFDLSVISEEVAPI